MCSPTRKTCCTRGIAGAACLAEAEVVYLTAEVTFEISSQDANTPPTRLSYLSIASLVRSIISPLHASSSELFSIQARQDLQKVCRSSIRLATIHTRMVHSGRYTPSLVGCSTEQNPLLAALLKAPSSLVHRLAEGSSSVSTDIISLVGTWVVNQAEGSSPNFRLPSRRGTGS